MMEVVEVVVLVVRVLQFVDADSVMIEYRCIYVIDNTSQNIAKAL
jgi:hypothetical protein